jgi:hypothetical protein
MIRVNRMAQRLLPKGLATSVLVVFVCLCVVLQMLGAPVTLLGLLTSDTPVESFSEDFSIPPSIPESGTPNRSRFTIESQSPHQFPIFPTSVFRPPQG